MQLKDIKWNIPNILSLYRLLMFPVILVLIILKEEQWFVVLFSINLITDILDGFIARTFNMQTEEGAVLDSIADVGSFILAGLGIYQLHFYLFTYYGYWLIIFVALFVASSLICQLKYKRPTAGLHLYSTKIGGYVQGIFFFVLFVFGMYDWLFYTAMVIGYYALVESITINLWKPVPQLNAKSIFHLIKKSSGGSGL